VEKIVEEIPGAVEEPLQKTINSQSLRKMGLQPLCFQ
jgi:hypothetical protein